MKNKTENKGRRFDLGGYSSHFSLGLRMGRVIWGLVWLFLFRLSPTPFHGWRRMLLRLFGAKIEASVHAYPSARVWAPWKELNIQGCGWWIPLGVPSLAQCLREATDATDRKRKAMGRKGYKFVKEHYTWQSSAYSMKTLYEWILRGGNRPDFII